MKMNLQILRKISINLIFPIFIQRRMLNRRNTFFVVLVLILIVVTSLFVFYGKNFFEQKPEPQPSVSWQIDLEHFISDIVYDDARVFVIDVTNIICLNKTNGEEIWRKVGNSGGASKLLLYENKLYAGTHGGAVTSFNKYTGEELLQFQAPVSTTWGGKSPPQEFFIEDGRLFVYQNGYAVFNATSGELFYDFGGYLIDLGNASAAASESSFIFMSGATRINPNNGEILWGLQGSASDPAVITQEKIILWNYNPAGGQELGTSILCIDTSGAILWSYDVSSPMYQPKVFNELVLFGAYDGNFYALQTSNGDLAWKILVTNQANQTKIVGNEGRDLTPVVSPIQIETKKNTAVWSFAFIQNYWGGVVEYVGTVCGIDAVNGNLLWKIPIENNASISASNLLYPISQGLALLNDYAFLTVGSDFYIINTQTGNIFEEKNFEHFLLQPTASKDMVFLAEELAFTAYK